MSDQSRSQDLDFLPGGLGRHKPLPAADSCAVPSAGIDHNQVVSYVPAWSLRVSRILPGLVECRLIYPHIFINMFLPRSSIWCASV